MRGGFEAIIERLRSGDEDVVRQALKDLTALPPPASHEEALVLLRVATEVPNAKAVLGSVAARLVTLADRLGFESPEKLAEAYPGLDEDARVSALGILVKSRPRDAIEQYAQLVSSFGWPKGANIFGSLQSTHAFPDVLFPCLLDASIPGDLTPSFRLALSYAEAGLLKEFPTARLTRDTAERLDFCEVRQQPDGTAWRWEEAYHEARYRLGVALDLLGYTPPAVSRSLLERAASLGDAKLQYFAVVSMLRLGLTPSPAAIESVAKSREMRSGFLRALEKLDMAWLYPDEYRRQELIAESDMVNWLCFPTELGREPDEIELIAREQAERERLRDVRLPLSDS